MNVLMSCLSSISGGAVAYVGNLVPELCGLFLNSSGNHRLKILAYESRKSLLSSVPDSQCLWVSGPELTGFHRLWWETLNLRHIASQEEADVLFIPYQVGPIVPGVKCVLMLTNMEPFLFRNYRYSPRTRLRNHMLRLLSTRMLRGADRVVAISDFTRNHLIQEMGIAPDYVRLIYHGRDVEFSPEADLKKDRGILESLGVSNDLLLTCGSLLPYRRCEDVIAAFSQCVDIAPNMQLVIAGSGTDSRYRKTIRQAIANSSCRDRILCVGHVSREEMITLYRHCAVCVIASEIEACPNIAIEAMSSGCAIVSSDRPPLPEMFKSCALEFRSRDTEDMALRIRSCLKNETLRRELKARALERARDFSWKKCAAKTYSALVDW